MPEDFGQGKAPPPARVLLVEDDETTRHLYGAMLEQAGFVVAEAENFNQAARLLDDSIDIALLDVMLKGQSGLDILKYIRLNFPSCPVIMISAFADKGNAIEALNEGAACYLQKPVDPRELFYTVRHWVDFSRMKEESRQDQHYQAMCAILKQNAASYRQLIEHMPAAIVVHDRGGKILYVNPAAVQMLRAANDMALIGKNVLEFVQPESHAAVKGLKQQIEAGKSCGLDELHFSRCDGATFLTEMKAVPVRYEQQQAVQVALLDITERRLVEETLKVSEARLKEAQEIAHVGSWEWDIKTDEVFFSDEACRIFGMENWPVGVNFQSVFVLIHPDDRAQARREIDTMLGEHTPLDMEHRIMLAGGEERIVNERGLVHPDAEGQVVRVTGTVQDITEQKRHEAILKDQVRRNEMILQTTQDGFLVVSLDGGLIEVNAAYCRMSGYSREELLAMNVGDLEAGERPADVARHLEAVMQQGRDRFETRHRSKDGGVFNLEVSASIFGERDERPLICAFLRDISKRKQAEEALAKYKIMFDDISDLAYICDDRENILFVNRTVEKLSGHSRQELIGKSFAPLFDDKNLATARDVYRRTMQGESPVCELAFRDTGIQCEYHNSPLREENGNIIGVMGVARDITGRRQAEEALKDQQRRLSSIIDTSRDLIFLKDKELRYLVANRAHERLLGRPASEIIGRTDFEVMAADEARQCHESDELALSTGELVRREEEMAGAWYEVSKLAARNGQGNITGVVGIIHDISERREMEEAIRKSEARFRIMADESPLAMQIFSPDGRTLRVNRAWVKMWGMTLEALDDCNVLKDQQLIEKGVMQEIRKAFAGQYAEIPAIYYERNKTLEVAPVGSGLWVRAYIYPVAWEGEEATSEIVLIQEDVTARMEAELRLKEHAEKLERFNRMAVGREIRMIELKKEINTLLVELGRERKYAIHEPQTPQ